MEKVRGDGHELLPGRFRLDTTGKIFPMRTSSHWNNPPKSMVGSPVLDTVTIRLDRALGHLGHVLHRKVGPDAP